MSPARPAPMMMLVAMLLATATSAQVVAPSEGVVLPKLRVRGESELRKPAELLTLSVGAVTERDTAGAAMNENATAMRAIVEALETTGLDEDEYETGRFQVRPVYSRRPRMPEENWKPRIVGYEVSNIVTIRTPKLDLAGKLIEAANGAGANSIDNIRFTLRDARRHRAEAIATATRYAREDARVLADAAGVELVRVLSLSLGETGESRPSPMMAMGRAAAAEVGGTPPITPGDVTVRASVTINYEIAPNEE